MPGINTIHSRPAEDEIGGAIIVRNARDQQDHSLTADHGIGGAINAQHPMDQQGPLTSYRARIWRGSQRTICQGSAGFTHVLQTMEAEEPSVPEISGISIITHQL